jgi:hypothetical protein
MFGSSQPKNPILPLNDNNIVQKDNATKKTNGNEIV